MDDANLHPRHEPPSLWAATAASAPATGALQPGEHRADLAIVGAGFTGLSAALHAASRGVRVVVLEAGEVGIGSSGRNNGQVIPTFTRADPDLLVRAFGPELGESVVAILRDSANTLFNLVRRHHIDCEAVQNGWVQPAHRDSRLAVSRARVAQWARRGAPARLIDRDEVAALIGSRFWHGGWINPTGGHINPLAFARGLARAAIDAGAQLHTHCPVHALQRHGSHWRLASAHGATLHARAVLLATHAYSGWFTRSPSPVLPRTLVPVRSYQMATEPLPPALLDAVLPSNVAMSDTQADLHFARRDAQGRIVTGGALVLHGGFDTRLRQRIGERLLKLWPALGAAGLPRFSHLWHGVFAATPDKLPRFLRMDDGVFGWIGCNGRGVAFGTAVGPLLADAALGDPAALRALPFEAPRAITGQAFASLGTRVFTLYYRWLDRRD